MALYHLTVSQIRRSAGQSAIAAAAYRAGECLYSDYYGEYSDYTRKGGVICSEILLPPHAPLEYQDRATLWNTVEQVEKHKKAQLAYSFDIALQNELSMEENIALAREFVQRCLVDKGMVADFAVHAPDKEDGGIPNPHFHVMTTMRPINPDGTWGQKQRREYVLDDEGNQVLDKDGSVNIALETMAGKGTEIGRTFEEIARIYDGVTNSHRLRVCFDTCHTNDAGYDVQNHFDEVMDEFDRIIGKDQIAVFHVNDSKNPLGAHKDRHENFGFGTIGFDSLRNVIYHKDFEDIPKILETPYIPDPETKKRSYPPYRQEIAMIREEVFRENLKEEIIKENVKG